MASDRGDAPPGEAVEAVAEALWQAESLRAADRRRGTRWADEGKDTRDKWRFMARAALGAAPKDWRLIGWLATDLEPTEAMVGAAVRTVWIGPNSVREVMAAALAAARKARDE
jgi:hypothetical protein